MDIQEIEKRCKGLDEWLRHHRHLDTWDGVQKYYDRLKALLYRKKNVEPKMKTA